MRLVSSVPESEWDETEQAWMLALKEYKATRCPLCGRSLAVCTDPANEFKFKAQPPTRCHDTTQRQVMAEKYAKGETRNAGALMYRTELKD